MAMRESALKFSGRGEISSDPISDNNDTDAGQRQQQQPVTRRPQTALTALTEPAPKNTVTYIFPEQRRMLQSFNQGDYINLVSEMLKIDQAVGPEPNQSRLLMRSDAGTVTEMSLVMLAQRTNDQLRKILRNTLTQRPSDMRRPNAAYKDVTDPVIYANYIVDKHGLGIPIDQYSTFLDAMDTVADFIDAFDAKQLTENLATERIERKLDKAKAKIISDINRAYEKIRMTSGNSNRGAPMTFFMDANNAKSLGVRVRNWANDHRQRVLNDARQQTTPVTHIPIPAEVGLAKEGYNRTQDHARLRKSSPDLFRLLHLVCRTVFPKAGFHLEQVFIFELGQAWQAEIGESLGSILCSSYVRAGGPNGTQAGISKTSIVTMNEDQWKTVVQRGKTIFRSWQHVEPNMKRYEDLQERNLEHQVEMQTNIKNHQRRERYSEENANLEGEINEIIEVGDELCDTLEAAVKGIAEANGKQKEQEHEATQMYEAMDVFYKVLRGN